MTAPTEPTPGAPVDEPTAQPVPTPGAPVTPPAQTPAAAAEDITSLPEWAQKQIREARAEAGKARTTAKQTAAEEARAELTAQVAKALGLAGDEPVDPAELTAQIEHAQANAWRNGTELAVHRVASRLGADAEALLDSNSFIDSLDDLVEDDPRSAAFVTALEAKVQAAMEKSPTKFKAAGQASTPTPTPAAPRPDLSQGARGTAPAPRPTSLYDAISKAIAPKT